MDLRIDYIFKEAMQGDTSFQKEEKTGLPLLFPKKYSQK